MTTKHIPGPWRVKPNSVGGPTVGPEGSVVADIRTYGGPHVGGRQHPQTDANARLIAAAPDLLEACETFAEWLGREESGFARAGNKRDTPEGERAWRDWYNENLRLCALAQEQARAAIARATGEQP